MTVKGTAQSDVITYTPTGPSAGTFQLAGLNTVFNFTTVNGTFQINGGILGVGNDGINDQVIVQGTNARDLFQIAQGNRTVQVLAYNTVALKTVTLGTDIQNLTAQGLEGEDTFQVIPAAGIAAFSGDTADVDNLLINIDGSAGGNNALVVWNNGATLAANQFVVDNRNADLISGTIRIFTAAVQWPDIDYQNIQVVSPHVAMVNNQPNLLVMGPDLNEPNEYQANATFLGSGSTLQVQNATIFPNSSEFLGVPADNDYYQVVAYQTGTLDFQVYFRVFTRRCCPAEASWTSRCSMSPGT